ncbi:hypothetical protein EVAR_90205_1 [Eumeta japonica]|uniref:Uncharacterized protein n=1 Tax=Eumeta variegata TaxID=151549 RepID=A0A4C1WW95_EUMVA|nr:hypothetical protein EVAR_90205_1 [Eumeta japonica]
MKPPSRMILAQRKSCESSYCIQGCVEENGWNRDHFHRTMFSVAVVVSEYGETGARTTSATALAHGPRRADAPIKLKYHAAGSEAIPLTPVRYGTLILFTRSATRPTFLEAGAFQNAFGC